MNRRRVLATLASSLACPLLAPAENEESGKGSVKKGWGGGNAEYHRKFRVSWYYSWSPKTRPSKAAEFVPMIKGAWSLKQASAIEKMKDVSYLLGFNEPERKKQGNISVKDALELWPRLEAIAEKRNLRLGSPAPSSDQAGVSWLKAFMKEAKSRKLRVDFMALHWYRGRDAGDFESFVKEWARDTRLPVWVTEFNGGKGPERDNFKFLKDSLRFLERSKDVERYAYFNVPKGSGESLIAKDGSLSKLGELYREA